jgi:alpha(1,3/1,4) fucosyltransferase
VLDKPELSISFHNFYSGFVPARSFLVRGLATRFTVLVEAVGRDVQVSGVFGAEPLPMARGGRPLRVWWTGEAQDPKASIFDLYLGFAPASILGPRWLRVPLWIDYLDWWDPSAPNAVGLLMGSRKHRRRERFCTFVASNNPTIRTEFFLRLNEARSVDSLGRYMNNRGRLEGVEALRNGLGGARFNIAFENQISPGYVTEKLLNPLIAGSVPIYWGAPEAATDFNPASFVSASEFTNLDALVRHVIWLDDNPEALAEISSAPAFPDNKVRYELTPAFTVDQITRFLSSGGDARVPQRWIDECARAADNRRVPLNWIRRILRKFPLARSVLHRLYELLGG